MSSSVAGAARVGPADVPFNDPVVWWNPEYWDYTELPAAWATTLGSPSVTIAVVDSGVKSIDDLALNMVPGHNVLDDSGDTTDTNGHGTEVASVIGARANNGLGTIGVCPICRIMPVKVSTDGYAASSHIAKGIRWATDHGARVVNVSIWTHQSSLLINKAISYADSKGVSVILISGNGTKNNDQGTNKPTANPIAAENPEAIRVASAGSPDNGQTIRLDPSSNYGKRLADVSAFGNPVPVDTIKNNSPDPGGSGTSMAAAVVSGIAGRLLSVSPGLTPAQRKAIIMSSCDPIGFNVPCGGVVSANRSHIVAQNPPESAYLHIKIAGKGKVVVAGQANCASSDCRYSLVAGKVPLAAAASSKWRFVRWVGGINSKKAKLTINMKAAKSIKAVFVKVKKRR